MDVIIVGFFLVTTSIALSSQKISLWFDMTQWYIPYMFLRFIVVLVKYRSTKRNEQTVSNAATPDTPPQDKISIRETIITVNIGINVITTISLLLHQFGLYNS
jgi:hypothetical protein